jgi:hypothetical protein
VLTERCPRNVHEIVAIRQEVADERTLSDRQNSIDLLALTGVNGSRDDDTFASFGASQVLHQTEVVELPLYSLADVSGLPHVQRLKSFGPHATHDVDARVGRERIQIDLVRRALA